MASEKLTPSMATEKANPNMLPQLPFQGRPPPEADTLSVMSKTSRASHRQSGGMPRRPRSTYRRHQSDYSLNTATPRAMSRYSTMDFSRVEDPLMMGKIIARRATLLGWFEEQARGARNDESSFSCVAVKGPDLQYDFVPKDAATSPLAAAVTTLNEAAVMSMISEVATKVIDEISPEQKFVMIESSGARIPVVARLKDVYTGLAHTSSYCIVREEKLILIWSHEPGMLLNVAHEVERQLFELGNISDDENMAMPPYLGSPDPESHYSSRSASFIRGGLDEKNEVYMKAVALEEGADNNDAEDIEANVAPRTTSRIHSIKIGLAIMLVIITQFLGVAKLLEQYFWDGHYLRFILVVTIPPLALFSLFFFINIVTGLFQLFIPASMCLKNTKFHSAIKPNPKRHTDYQLPHITVQMPVYKEGLKGVIVPTMVSVMKAIQFYEEAGGTASVFINDDGMQCIQPELAEARKQYYRENGIGFTARLPNRKAPAGGRWPWSSKPAASEESTGDIESLSPQEMSNRLQFERKGKFKKASNMNYGLAFSIRVEDELNRLQQLECQRRNCSHEDLTADDDDELYEQALERMLAADKGQTWAEGNIRIGELLLLIDCDTRVPEDCLLYGALELHESPEVAIVQHGSGVMQVAHNTFENGITYFTNIVYTAIKYGVGTGDVSPFVGHNAFLRWKALQSIAFVDASDGQTKWWSDAHVSEDFDISLRLQMQGMTIRLATYHHGGFKEGVSLTLYDELTRWEKYAYGCNELVFHPFYQWIYKGPVTRLFLRFLWSNMPVTSKVTITAYIFTYYAIASGMFLTAVNYVAVGLFNDELDHVYQPSWGIWFSLVVVFNLFGSVAFSMARHQLKEENFWRAILQAIKWLPFLVVFFGGISLNCAKALLCHAFGINIEWASTAKEMGPTGFYIGIQQIVKQFKWTWCICLVLAAAMIYFAVGAPWGWTIKPGSDPMATWAVVPLSIQICSATFLPFFLGLN
ncbi:glycosyl transferase family group 2-domain-containing protein [Xylariomycetidae sp. FL2044]|nr:glycosyl transferase family group 2-domain-containing protein [Xylariomycetidae sp. FL2044]